MKDLQLLVWLTQLGLSTAVPLAGFVLLGVWLHRSWGWGTWCIVVGVIVGVICAIDGLRTSVRAMERMSQDSRKSVPGFNDHE